MSYFVNHYGDLTYPIEENDRPGFRLAQTGAIHAAAAHFVTRTDPGIITMPTGSGKTAVLIAAAFVLRAQRVLVLTPSRLVREQVADEFASLATLRGASALPAELPAPRVTSVRKRITSAEEWEALREFDVVVGTVQSISPEYADVPEPPADLFDVVLVDEAHHSPARTWKAVLDHFVNSRRLLFTATPFRQDQREIKGRFIFTYDLRRAFHDGVFGQIAYQPVRPDAEENPDVAIARAAERQVQADRDAGFQHHLMVRTDSKRRAEELLTIYGKQTLLRMRIVTSDKSLRYVRGVISQLQAGELDGIVCVNMLGEGFNFPSLKIAAIHSPHRSLNVTLQFIGRFARTVGVNLGPATFLAIPSEIEIEAERLYDARAVWQEIVQNLSAARVHQEAETREVLESFEAPQAVAPDLSDLSLYVLEPYYHVKVYQLSAVVDLTKAVDFPPNLQVVYETVSLEHNAAVYITRETSQPRWTTDDRLVIVHPDLFIFYQHPESRLLFISASRRSAGVYQHLIESFSDADPKPLPLVRLNRALNDLATLEFFNVGMRNRVAGSTAESYRNIMGSNADRAVLPSDSRLYHRGHVFGRGVENGNQVTIGLSSASKIWSNQSSKLPELIAWCGRLAARINSGRAPVTHSGLDYLDVGEEVEELPGQIIAVDWDIGAYRNPPLLRFDGLRGETRVSLLDASIEIDPARRTPDTVGFRISYADDFAFDATFSFETDRFVEPAPDREPQAFVERERDSTALIAFLNQEMPHFYTADLGHLHGYNYLRPTEAAELIAAEQIFVADWAAMNVDITVEFGTVRAGRVSVHAGLEEQLQGGASEVVYYDHGTGEIADFVSIDRLEGGGLLIRFHHCKKAGGDRPGHRLDDVYEIAGQAVKSVTWAAKQKILSHIKRRFNHRLGSHRFVKGDLEALEVILADAVPAQIQFEFVAVQPGLRKEELPPELGNVLGAASDHLVRGGFRPLVVMASSVP